MLKQNFQPLFVLRKEFFGGLVWNSISNNYFMIPQGDYRELHETGTLKLHHLLLTKDNYREVSFPSDNSDYLNYPIRVHIAITNKCNQTCGHCFYDNMLNNAHPLKDLRFRELKNLFDELYEYGSMELFIGGGEPFIRDDWFKIFKYAENRSLQLYIFSNGTLVDKDTILKLNKLNNIGYLSISLEGFSKNTYASVRDENSWDKVLAAINLLRKYSKFPVYIRYTVTSQNVKEVGSFVSFYKEICSGQEEKIGIKIRPVLPTGRAMNSQNLIVSYEDYLHFLLDVQSELGDRKNIHASIDKDAHPNIEDRLRFSRKTIGLSRHIPLYTGFGGSGGYTSVYINSNGDLHYCVMPQQQKRAEQDNILNYSLYHLWHNSYTMKARRSITGNTDCLTCNYYIWCRGGCRARAIATYGDENAKDPWCVRDLINKVGVDKATIIVNSLC
jgi:radical SAM protein with 4Fe4S-binding SPASM domain